MNELESFDRYFAKFLEVVKLHQELGFGKNPHISSVFSEKLVRNLLGYEKWHNKDYDAKYHGAGVEIKATGTKAGTTTICIDKIKQTEFSHLIWVYINFNLQQAEIHIIDKSTLLADKKLMNSPKERPSIRLSQCSPKLLKIYKFNNLDS